MSDPTPAPPVSTWAKYRKALGVVGVTVATFVLTVLTGGITPTEWILIVGIGVSAIGTAVVPNMDAGVGKVAKTLVTFLLAGLAVAAGWVLTDGVDTTEVFTALVAAFAAVGITALPNDWPPATLATRATGSGLSAEGEPRYPRT